MWKNILVATDFSECSRRALRDAMMLAQLGKGDVTLVHVTPLPAGLDSTVLVHPEGLAAAMTMADYLEQASRVQLEREVASMGVPAGVSVVCRSLLGDPIKEVTKLAGVIAADLLVVGTHGRSGWRHMVLGSIAERLIQASQIPVLTSKSAVPCVEDDRPKDSAELRVAAEQMG